MEQIVAQNKEDLEQAGWAFDSQQISDPIPIAIVHQNGTIEGDISKVFDNARLKKPFLVYLAFSTDVITLATYARFNGSLRLLTPVAAKTLEVIIDGNFTLLSWQFL
jgi:hypothetical protein